MLKRFAGAAAVAALLAGAVAADVAADQPKQSTKAVAQAASPGGQTATKSPSSADTKRLQALRQELDKERIRYRELRQKGAPQADVSAQWQKMEKVRAQIRELQQNACPYGGSIRLGQGGRKAGAAMGRGLGPRFRGVTPGRAARADNGRRGMHGVRQARAGAGHCRAKHGSAGRGYCARHGSISRCCPRHSLRGAR